MAGEEEARQANVAVWQQKLREEQSLPVDWREGIYSGIVERLKMEKPGLRSLPTELVMKIMFRESKFDPRARGSAGEVGLMQVKPDTAEWLSRKRGLGLEDLEDPRENILAGMTYLKDLTRMFGLEQGVEAYNVGPTGLRQGKRNPNYVRAVLSRAK